MSYSTRTTGIRCPSCLYAKSRVIDSRNCAGKLARWRRLECDRCSERYTTYEIAALEYEQMQAAKVDAAQVDSLIASLQAIKVRFSKNGNGQ